MCRSDLGIYELEEHLKEVHGDRIGLIVLQKDDRTYTVRQVDPFLPISQDEGGESYLRYVERANREGAVRCCASRLAADYS